MDPLWAELINSDWHDHRGTGACEDRIGNDDWLGGFLDRAGWRADGLPNPDERNDLRGLRGLLRRMTDVLRSGGALQDEDLEAINRFLAACPVVRRVEAGDTGLRIGLVAVPSGMDRVRGEVAASFAAMLEHGDPSRIKVCANPDCGWVMYDSSRNRTRRWCDKTECGNLIKVRRYRQKKREKSGG